MTITAARIERDCAEAFSAALLERAEVDDRVCLVVNDSAETHHALAFQQRFPSRVIDVGIAEQNMVGVAAGLANSGRLPFVCSAACFLTARALEQIKVDIAYSRSKVILCGFVSGLGYGALGGTHHAIEDLAWMRSIPNLVVLAPASANEAEAAVTAASEHNGPVYIRLISKTLVPELFAPGHCVRVGGSDLLRDGRDVTLIGTGLMTSRLLDAAATLAQDGIECRVLHLGSVKPIDADAIELAARATGRFVVAEDHVISGGLAGAVAEVVVARHPVPVLSIGIPDVFAPIGPVEFLHEHFGLTHHHLASRVRDWLHDPSEVRR